MEDEVLVVDVVHFHGVVTVGGIAVDVEGGTRHIKSSMSDIKVKAVR